MAKKVTVDSFVGVLIEDPKAVAVFTKHGLASVVMDPARKETLKTVTIRDGARVLGLNPKDVKALLKDLNDAGVEG